MIVFYPLSVKLMRMKVAVIGAKGMLGRDMVAACESAEIPVVGLDLPEVDITNYTQLMEKVPSSDWIINCAAYTRVDDAEKERDTAFAVNVQGVRNLARLGMNRGATILHVSTDYVFDGRSDKPYKESDRCNPLNMYGASKLSGEKDLRAEGGAYLIVRTQSLFGKHGHNFVKAIVRKLRDGDESLQVVDDQFSAPTYTPHLADALLRLIKAQARGVVHATAAGACSWFEFAQAIVEQIKPGHEVCPTSTAVMKRPALRPMNALLDNTRYEMLTGTRLPSWQEGLTAYLREEQWV